MEYNRSAFLSAFFFFLLKKMKKTCFQNSIIEHFLLTKRCKYHSPISPVSFYPPYCTYGSSCLSPRYHILIIVYKFSNHQVYCFSTEALQVHSPLFLPRRVWLRRGSPTARRTGAGADGPVDLLLPGVEQLLNGRVGEVVKEAPNHLLRLLLPLHESLLSNNQS